MISNTIKECYSYIDKSNNNEGNVMYDDNLDAQEQAELYSLVNYNHISYLLYIVSFFTTGGLLWIVPIIMNYYKRKQANGTWLASHFDWQIKTFWYSILGVVVGCLLMFFSVGSIGISLFTESQELALGSLLTFVLGGFLALITVIWHLYRIIRGWIALANAKAVP